MILEFGIQPDPNVPKVQITLLESAKKNKSLCTNQPCDLCDTYGHYSHHFHHLSHFHDALSIIREMYVSRNDLSPSLLVVFGINSSPGLEVA